MCVVGDVGCRSTAIKLLDIGVVVVITTSSLWCIMRPGERERRGVVKRGVAAACVCGTVDRTGSWCWVVGGSWGVQPYMPPVVVVDGDGWWCMVVYGG